MPAQQIRLEGAPNFRDLGGYRTTDGRRVRHGAVYRSESLAHLTPRDLDTLRRIGVRLAADLRSALERSRNPSRWPEGSEPQVLHVDITVDMRAGNEALLALLREDPSEEGALRLMTTNYRNLPRAFAPSLASIFDALACEAPSLPFVFHCTAGKDRTGFLAAMLLSALGVERDEIDRDYALTTERSDLSRLLRGSAEYIETELGHPPEPAMVEALVAARPHYLAAAFDAIDGEWGSVDAYLEAVGGLHAPRRDRLRDSLLSRP
jgi:protein-tyrosine phosphatase